MRTIQKTTNSTAAFTFLQPFSEKNNKLVDYNYNEE